MLKQRLRNSSAFDLITSNQLSYALDSGAHSVYMQMVVKRDGGSIERKYDVIRSQAFKDYVERYIEYCHEHADRLRFVVNLDVIGNAELTWELQKYLEENGLNPVPVFHNGEDFKWLRRYMDDHDYIGIGGLGQFSAKASYIAHADKIFRLLSNPDGSPKYKTHGFAVTSPELVARFPWYTIDSSTWCTNTRYGRVLIPKVRNHNGEFRYTYTRSPAPVRTSDRAFELGAKDHLHRHSEQEQRVLTEYLESHIKPLVGPRYLELLSKEYWARDIANGHFFMELQREAKELAEQRWGYGEGCNVFLAGAPAVHDVPTMRTVYTKLMRSGCLNLLGTFFYPRVFNNAMAAFPNYQRDPQ